ncbi:MAG TPA: hypothetical protein VHE80_01700 [Acidimicrobiales bacterium]|nr:hypothetical protein [Acidimicrobiales bacterium]
MRRFVLVLLLLVVVGAGAPETVGAAHTDRRVAYVATVRTNAGDYRAVIRDPRMLRRAVRNMVGVEGGGVPTGPLAWGDGGVNHGHVWHVTELGFADFTIELCDGTVEMVDADPDYWVDTVGHFCPWSGRVVKLEPMARRLR